ncbi:hypothetical protein GZL_08494 [Streptomyces sp. 769]|nr:hypothetical protein GZL_08494 [Streptomyces sp. 769]
MSLPPPTCAAGGPVGFHRRGADAPTPGITRGNLLLTLPGAAHEAHPTLAR